MRRRSIFTKRNRSTGRRTIWVLTACGSSCASARARRTPISTPSPLSIETADIRRVVEADAPGSVAVQNLPAETCGVSYATEKEADGSASDITAKSGESLTASIPAIGILTVCAKNHPANKQFEQNNSNKTIRRKFAD